LIATTTTIMTQDVVDTTDISDEDRVLFAINRALADRQEEQEQFEEQSQEEELMSIETTTMIRVAEISEILGMSMNRVEIALKTLELNNKVESLWKLK